MGFGGCAHLQVSMGCEMIAKNRECSVVFQATSTMLIQL